MLAHMLIKAKAELAWLFPFAVSACLPYSIPRQCFGIDVWGRASGAMRRQSTLCNENVDDDDDGMVAAVSCDAVLQFYISIVWVEL